MKKQEFNELIERAFCEGYMTAIEEAEEQREFAEAENEEKENKKKKKSSGKSGKVGYGAYLAGAGLNGLAGYKAMQYFDKNPSEESKEFYDKLKNEIKSKGDKIDDENYFYVQGVKNAAYSPKMKGMRDFFAARIREDRKKGKDSKWAKIKKDVNEQNGGINIGKKGFKIDRDLAGKADILAHEMGHEYYMDGKGKKSLGGLLHNQILRNPATGMIGGTLAGLHSGFKKEKLERQGKKESKWNKYKSVIIPGLSAAALVGSEAAASLHGYKKLKDMGASKELLKDARNNLATTLGTYAGLGAMEVGNGLISRAVGKKLAQGYYKIKDSKNKKKEGEEKKED